MVSFPNISQPGPQMSWFPGLFAVEGRDAFIVQPKYSLSFDFAKIASPDFKDTCIQMYQRC